MGWVDTERKVTHPEANKKGTPASPATARANMVFPVPGGPVNNTPLGSFPPRLANAAGSLRNSTTSCNSYAGYPISSYGTNSQQVPTSFASSTPWTSLKLTVFPGCGSNSDCFGPALMKPVLSNMTDNNVTTTEGHSSWVRYRQTLAGILTEYNGAQGCDVFD